MQSIRTVPLFAAVALTVTALTAGPLAAAPTVWIPVGNAGEAIVADAATRSVIGRVTDLPEVHGLAVTPDGRLLVAASFAEVETGGPTPPKPAGMAEEEHAAHHGGGGGKGAAGAPASFASLVDAASGKILRRVAIPGAAHHVAISPDGALAAFTHPGTGKISVIGLAQGAVIAEVATGPFPNYAVFAPDGGTLFVSNAGNGTVSEVDTARWFVRRNVAVGASPEHLALSADGRRLYVAEVDDGTVAEIDTGAARVLRRFEVGGLLHGLDLAEDGTRLFVAARERGELVAIDLTAGTLRRRPLAPEPYHLATVPGTGTVWVSSAAEPLVWVVDAGRLEPVAEIPVPETGHQMAVALR